MLRRSPADVRVREVVEAVEGPMALKQCLLWSNDCGESEPCPLHYRLEQFHAQLDDVLNELTLAEYADTSAQVKFQKREATS